MSYRRRVYLCIFTFSCVVQGNIATRAHWQGASFPLSAPFFHFPRTIYPSSLAMTSPRTVLCAAFQWKYLKTLSQLELFCSNFSRHKEKEWGEVQRGRVSNQGYRNGWLSCNCQAKTRRTRTLGLKDECPSLSVVLAHITRLFGGKTPTYKSVHVYTRLCMHTYEYVHICLQLGQRHMSRLTDGWMDNWATRGATLKRIANLSIAPVSACGCRKFSTRCCFIL